MDKWTIDKLVLQLEDIKTVYWDDDNHREREISIIDDFLNQLAVYFWLGSSSFRERLRGSRKFN